MCQHIQNLQRNEATKILQVWKVSVSVAIGSCSIGNMIIRGKHTHTDSTTPTWSVQSVCCPFFHGSGRILVSGPGSPSSGSAHHDRSLGGYTCRVQVPHHTPMFPQFLSPLQAPSLHHNGQRRRPQQVSRNWWHLGYCVWRRKCVGKSLTQTRNTYDTQHLHANHQ